MVLKQSARFRGFKIITIQNHFKVSMTSSSNLFVVGHQAGDERRRGHRQVDLLTLDAISKRKKETRLKLQKMNW